MDEQMKDFLAMAATADEIENGAEYATNSEELEADNLDEAQERLKIMMDNLKAARQGTGIQIHYAVYLVAFVTIFTVVGFFAYKLVKSLQDKEKKREDKRKLKEQKKKK